MAHSSLHAQPLVSRACRALRGVFTPPGDKSISHRTIMLGGIAEGITTIQGLLEGEDVLRTVAALQALGASINKKPNGEWSIQGTGLSHLQKPNQILDMGNSGTAARLLIGLLSGLPFTSSFTGDASLCKRPMGRIITPLSLMGATFQSTDGKLPLDVTGAKQPLPLHYRLPVASAQVKSAILLAGLSAEGMTTVVEKVPTRDHSENMLRHFGATVTITLESDGAEAICVTGRPFLKGQQIIVPADPSSAAFPLVAALLNAGSNITLRNVGLNPRRAGLFETLREMGASITYIKAHDECGEPVADLKVEASRLKGITVPAERAPSMIDEFPILAIAAACAEGATRMCGLGELRVKESDRLALMAEGLKKCGVEVAIEKDDLLVYGTGHPPEGHCLITTEMDHRIAMSFLVLGSVTKQPITIDDGRFIATSFPEFIESMNNLGMDIAKSFSAPLV